MTPQQDSVSPRVGFLGPKVSVEKAHSVLLALLPADAETLFNFHKHNYWHGQQICFFLKPNCARCPLKGFCTYYQEHFGPATAEALAAKAASAPRELLMRTKDTIHRTQTIATGSEAVDNELDTQVWSMGEPAFVNMVAALKERMKG